MPTPLDRQPVAQHPLLGQCRRGEARPRHVRRREPLRALRFRHRVVVRVDLDPGVVGIRPPRIPPRARPAQRRGLARAQHQVLPRIRLRHEARAAGVGRQVEFVQAGQRLEYPVLDASRAERIVGQVQNRHRGAQSVEHPCRQRAQRVAIQKEARHSAQPCEVPGLQRRDARSAQPQRARDPGELVIAHLRAVRHQRVVRLRLRQQRVAHLRRAIAYSARQHRRRAVDPVRRVRRHRIVAEKCRRAVAVDNGPAREPEPVRRHRDAVVVRVVCRYRVAEHQHRRAGPREMRRLPRNRPHLEPDRRRAGHRHRRREGHAHLDPLALPVGRVRLRHRRQRHRCHRRRPPAP